MPLPMPMWPPSFIERAPRAASTLPAFDAAAPVRRRWLIIEGSRTREVEEAEYRGVAAACERVETARGAAENVVTHIRYRAGA